MRVHRALIVTVISCAIVCGPRAAVRSEEVAQDTISMSRIMEMIKARKDKFIGKPAPSVVSTTLLGKPWRLEDQKGKVVILDFWATWCKGCVQSMPQLKGIQEKYKRRKDVVILGVALDKDVDKVRKFCRANRIRWDQLCEPEKGFQSNCAVAFDVHGIPEVCVVDRNGVVAGVFLGVGQIDDMIKRLSRP